MVDIVLVREAYVAVSHCELVVVLEFDAAVPYIVDILDSRFVVAFHLAVYLVVAAMLNPLGGIKVHVVVVLVLPVLQEVLTVVVHLTDQFWSL